MKLNKREILLVNSIGHPRISSKKSSSSSSGNKSDEHSGHKSNNLSDRNLETIRTDVSSESDSDENEIPPLSTAECTSPHEGRQLVHTILPIKIDDLFNLLFTKSKFLLKFHETRQSTDINLDNEWVENKEENIRTRIVTLTVVVGAVVGPKTTKVTECQIMRDCSKEGELYSIDINSENAGIPYADSFCVSIHYCLAKSVEDHTMLSVHAQIKYKKSIWGVVKGFIERNTWAGLVDFYSALLRALQSEICIPPAKGKGKRMKRAAPQLPLSKELSALSSLDKAVEKNSSNIFNTPGKTDAKQYKYMLFSVIILLFTLICLNGMLLLKVWKLEEHIVNGAHNINGPKSLPHYSTTKQGDSKNFNLWQEREMQHENRLEKWHNALRETVDLLKKTENSLKTIADNAPRK